MLLRDETKFVLKFKKPGHGWTELSGSERDTRENAQKVWAKTVNGYPPSYKWRMIRTRVAEEIVIEHGGTA